MPKAQPLEVHTPHPENAQGPTCRFRGGSFWSRPVRGWALSLDVLLVTCRRCLRKVAAHVLKGG